MNIVTAKKIVESNIISQPDLRTPLCLLGPVGVGKTSIVKDLCMKYNKKLTLINLAWKTKEDITGIPVINFLKLVNDLKEDKKCQQEVYFTRLPLHDSDVIFIDEITNADYYSIKLVMQMISEKICGPHKLKDDVYIICAGNNLNHSSLAKELPEPMLTRMAFLNIDYDLDSIIRYAIDNNWNEHIIGYIKYKPECIGDSNSVHSNNAFATPRSLENLNNILGLNINENLKTKYICATIGFKYGMDFLEFVNKTHKSLSYEDIKDCIENNKMSELEEKINGISYESKLVSIYRMSNYLLSDSLDPKDIVKCYKIFKNNIDKMVYTSIFASKDENNVRLINKYMDRFKDRSILDVNDKDSVEFYDKVIKLT